MTVIDMWQRLKSTNPEKAQEFKAIEEIAIKCFTGDCKGKTLNEIRDALDVLPQSAEIANLSKMKGPQLRLWATAIAVGVLPSTRP